MSETEPDRPAEGTDHAPRWTFAIVERVGAFRDGFLVLGGVVYLAGYLSWTLYAYEHDLGLIPALDAQFFSAGLVPAAIAVAFFGSARFLFYVKRWLGKDLTDREKKVGTLLGALAPALILLGFLPGDVIDGEYARFKPPLLAGGVVCFYAAGCFSRSWFERKIMQPFALFMAWAYLIMGGFWFFYGYYYEWFPLLPQELGGPQPRCVIFDLAVSHLSEQSRRKLGLPPGAAGVQRSGTLHLIFQGSDFTIVERPATPESGRVIFRIRDSTIESIFPCD